jgi:quercetin dioxygenase-like cupin family protein
MHTLTLEQQGETIVFFADPAAPRCEFEVRLAPGADGPPPHYHLGQDESFEVVSGVFHATLDGTEHRLVAGERLTVRSGVVHTFRNGLADRPLVLRGVMEPPLNFQWALSEMAGAAIRSGGSWKHLSLLDAGWVMYQVRGEYYAAGIPRPVHHLITGLLAVVARLTGRHRSMTPRPRPAALRQR